ncbi:MAG: hypothetical protein RMM17_13000 [Acidobacteriota bacterium]|nr:hypothetical protein [Blastocatellia bacterium]MDW8413584.1 hypothetical protein [Acidobacteriota bacterium]
MRQTCKQIRTQIDEGCYNTAIETHCSSCIECASYLRQIEGVKQLIASCRVAAPADFNARLRRQIAARKAEKLPLTWNWKLAIASLIVLLLSISSHKYWLEQRQPSTKNQTTAPSSTWAAETQTKYAETKTQYELKEITTPIVTVTTGLEDHLKQLPRRSRKPQQALDKNAPIIIPVVIGAQPILDTSTLGESELSSVTVVIF